ncbi:MAG: hypothetical protein HGA36_00965 [Candidatus Moranbacteria bacterium]|nr:hypothetical protein [Candidatus Moranbacteria bacterium]
MSKKESAIESGFGALFFIIFFVMLKSTNNINTAIVYTFAVLVPGIVLFVLYKKMKRKEFFDNKNTLEKIRMMTPSEFESFVCNLFDHLGYKTQRTGGPNDGGIDVIAEKNGIEHYIQCKKFITRQVSVGEMRDFYGAIVDKLANAKAFFITTNVFTLEAEKFAAGKPIELVDGKKIMEYIVLAGIKNDIPNKSSAETMEKCPLCNSTLILRTARKGQNAGNSFYGCANYPRCKFAKNIS